MMELEVLGDDGAQETGGIHGGVKATYVAFLTHCFLHFAQGHFDMGRGFICCKCVNPLY